MQYFPHNSDKFQSFIPENELEKIDEATKRWYSDFPELLICRKNQNYGRTKCFDSLLDLVGNEPRSMWS